MYLVWKGLYVIKCHLQLHLYTELSVVSIFLHAKHNGVYNFVFIEGCENRSPCLRMWASRD